MKVASMWKFIKGCYSVTKETVKLAGRGVDELTIGLEALHNELESFNKETEETMPLRKLKNTFKVWKQVIDLNRPLKSSKHLYEIFKICEVSLLEIEKLIQIALDQPNTRQIIIPLINELEKMMVLASNELINDPEFSIELEEMYQDGLDRNSSIISIFNYYFIHTPPEKLELLAKQEYPRIKENSKNLHAGLAKIQAKLC